MELDQRASGGSSTSNIVLYCFLCLSFVFCFFCILALFMLTKDNRNRQETREESEDDVCLELNLGCCMLSTKLKDSSYSSGISVDWCEN